MRVYISLLFAGLMLAFTGCDSKEEVKTERVVKKEEKKDANVFKLEGIAGESLSVTKEKEGLRFEGLEDKVVLVDFFATWCPPCKATVPHLINLQNRYKEDFEILGVLVNDEKSNAELQEYTDENGINYTIYNSDENYRFADALGGIKSIPFMILYDTNGNYFTHYIGAVPEEMIASDIEKALEK